MILNLNFISNLALRSDMAYKAIVETFIGNYVWKPFHIFSFDRILREIPDIDSSYFTRTLYTKTAKSWELSAIKTLHNSNLKFNIQLLSHLVIDNKAILYLCVIWKLTKQTEVMMTWNVMKRNKIIYFALDSDISEHWKHWQVNIVPFDKRNNFRWQ